MEQTECSETSEHKIHTPENHPKEKNNLQNTAEFDIKNKYNTSRDMKHKVQRGNPLQPHCPENYTLEPLYSWVWVSQSV